jgi:hypothetical protein
MSFMSRVSTQIMLHIFHLLYAFFDSGKVIEIFDYHKFRFDKVDMVDAFRNIFFLLIAFLFVCFTVHAAFPSPLPPQPPNNFSYLLLILFPKQFITIRRRKKFTTIIGIITPSGDQFNPTLIHLVTK